MPSRLLACVSDFLRPTPIVVPMTMQVESSNPIPPKFGACCGAVFDPSFLPIALNMLQEKRNRMATPKPIEPGAPDEYKRRSPRLNCSVLFVFRSRYGSGASLDRAGFAQGTEDGPGNGGSGQPL